MKMHDAGVEGDFRYRDGREGPNWFAQNMMQRWPESARGTGRSTSQLLDAVAYVQTGTSVVYVQGHARETPYNFRLLEYIREQYSGTYPILKDMYMSNGDRAEFRGHAQYLRFTSMGLLGGGTLYGWKGLVIIDHAARRPEVGGRDISRAMDEIIRSRCPYR